MDEVKFCLKSLAAAILVVFLLQIHVGGQTLEQHAHGWIETSPVAHYLEKVAEGATLAIRNTGKSVSQMTAHAFGGSDTQRASRMNLDFQRSPAVVKKQKAFDN
jgi:hypothetical protein